MKFATQISPLLNYYYRTKCMIKHPPKTVLPFSFLTKSVKRFAVTFSFHLSQKLRLSDIKHTNRVTKTLQELIFKFLHTNLITLSLGERKKDSQVVNVKFFFGQYNCLSLNIYKRREI